MHGYRCAIALAAVVVISAPAAAQQTLPKPAFDAASIKRNTSGPTGTNIRILPNRLTLINLQLRAIIQIAYGIQQAARLDAPQWTDTERYDIVATTPADVPGEQMRLMLRALLEERFQLKVHSEHREVSGYALMLAREGGSPGPNLRPSTAVCANLAPATKEPGPAGPPPIVCGPRPGGPPGRLTLVGSPIQQLAGVVALIVGRTVTDRTGLPGMYDIELSYRPEPGAPGDAGDAGDNPSIFTALQEQLGLKLQTEETTMAVTVVDRLERPSEN